VQTRVGVTFAGLWSEPSHVQRVSQAFCSTVSCGYVHGVSLDDWEPLATLVLDAAHEATLHAAAVDLAAVRGSGRIWLTFVGGGVFGNDRNWIAVAIRCALTRCADLALDVRTTHYRLIDTALARRVDEG